MEIPFSPPYIGEEEINEVVDTLRSGWITTGPKTKKFEKMLSEYCDTDYTVCLNSATAALELILRALGIGEGDEIISCAYTYTASVSVVCHVGATIKLVDCNRDDYLIDYDELDKAVTKNTKAIIPVDIGGVPCDYDRLQQIVEKHKADFTANNELQKAIGRIMIISDGAHSLGSLLHGKKACTYPDFTTFSFHAVKNLTTGEGGAVTWKTKAGIDSEKLYHQLQLLSLHGQSKDAFSKMQKGSWEYDIVAPYYKYNMTDIMASIGIAQLNKYDGIINKRRKMAHKFDEAFEGLTVKTPIYETDVFTSNCHLYMINANRNDISYRNEIIKRMAEHGVSCNVHFKPLPLLTAYKSLGFDMKDYPNAYNRYINEISMPIYTGMTDEEQDYVISSFKKVLEEI